MVYYIDKQGRQIFEKNLFSRERLDIGDNPLFEKILRAPKMTPELFKRGNELVAYTKNIDNRYDLDVILLHYFEFYNPLTYSFYNELKILELPAPEKYNNQ